MDNVRKIQKKKKNYRPRRLATVKHYTEFVNEMYDTMNLDKSIKGIRKIAEKIGIAFTLADTIKKSLIESKIIMVSDKKTFAIVDRNEALKRVKSETLKVKNIVNFERKKMQKISM